MKFLIHACPKREWFVYGYIIPEMVRQGIDRDDIEVWMDRNGDGNLKSCVKSFASRKGIDGGTWHLQDDVALAGDFAEKAEQYDDGIVCGFGRKEWQPIGPMSGNVPAVFMWNSFPCIRIPNDIAVEFSEWVTTDAAYRDTYREAIEHNKADDTLWFDFITEKHLDMYITNLDPNIVEHIDDLIGGSVLHKRDGLVRSSWWTDTKAVERAEARIKELQKLAP